MESTDINLQFAKNQKLPGGGLDGPLRGDRRSAGRSSSTATHPRGAARRPSSDSRFAISARSLRDVFGNDFKTWSFAVNVSYPIGTSVADAAYAQARLQKQQEHDAAREPRAEHRPGGARGRAPRQHQPEASRGDAQGARVRAAAAGGR